MINCIGTNIIEAGKVRIKKNVCLKDSRQSVLCTTHISIVLTLTLATLVISKIMLFASKPYFKLVSLLNVTAIERRKNSQT